MGLFDKVKKQIGNAAEITKKAAENLPDSVKEIDTEKTLKGFKKIGSDTFQRAKTEGAGLYDMAKASFKKKEITKLIREQDALEIMYYLIASDMSVEEEEIEMFDSIGHELDPAYETYRNSLIARCNAEIDGIHDLDEFYDIVHEQVNRALLNSLNSEEGSIRPTVLLWDLVSIAFAEKEYSANEKRLIRSVARTLGIDASVLKEMESTIQTMMALNEEENVLKAANRRYSEVEPFINEIADRKQTIMQNMRALMLD